MAIPTSIHNLLSGKLVEWARIEFKTTWDPEASLKTICAFANDLDNWGGGYVVIGVNEKDGIPLRPLVGVPLDKVDAWQKNIFEKMFFNSEPEQFFPYAQIDVVQFPDGEGGDRIVEQIFKGPLHEQLRAALRYIKNVIITEKIIKYPDRAEADRFYNYPYAAIEEALANAVYHKAYDEREPIEVRVTRDMIEIISHPGPDRSVTIEGLKTFKVYSRRYRNRRIGEFLKDLHLTEGRNTGFKKILDALKVNGSPLPEFETDEAHDYFVSRFFVREGFYDDIDSEGNENTSEKKVAIKSGEKKRRKKVLKKSTEKKVPKKSTEKKITEKTMQNYNAILDYMQYGEWYKTLDFIEVLDVKDSRIRKILNELEAKGELISKGSTKGKVYQKVEK